MPYYNKIPIAVKFVKYYCSNCLLKLADLFILYYITFANRKLKWPCNRQKLANFWSVLLVCACQPKFFLFPFLSWPLKMRFKAPCKKTNNYQKQPKLLDFAIDHGDMKIQLQWYYHPFHIIEVQCAVYQN